MNHWSSHQQGVVWQPGLIRSVLTDCNADSSVLTIASPDCGTRLVSRNWFGANPGTLQTESGPGVRLSIYWNNFDVESNREYHMRVHILLQTGPHWNSESPTSPVFWRTVLLRTPPTPPSPPPTPPARLPPNLERRSFSKNISPSNKLLLWVVNTSF